MLSSTIKTGVQVIGISIPGYRIVRAIGRGGMATVYLAIQENFQRKVALKVMSAELAKEQDFSERFLREARIVSQLVHPNIVTVHDVGIQNGHHYLSMEYIEGQDLKQALPEMNAEQIFRVLHEVAQALDYAGNKGYVHRDVKPENIMLHSHDGRAVLMDFGIARASRPDNSMTRTGTAVGTPHYMSPEQARGAEVDGRSDLYSLGVLFYYLLVGKVPYEADSPVAVGIKHLTEPVPTLPAPLACYQSLLNQLMAKKPEQRYQTGREVCKALEKVPAEPLQQWHQRKEFCYQSVNYETPVRGTAAVPPDEGVAAAAEKTIAKPSRPLRSSALKTELPRTPDSAEPSPTESLHIPKEDLAARHPIKKSRNSTPILFLLLVAVAAAAYILFPAQLQQSMDKGMALVEQWSAGEWGKVQDMSPAEQSSMTGGLKSVTGAGAAAVEGGKVKDSLRQLWQQIAKLEVEVEQQPQRRGNLIELYRQVLDFDPKDSKALAGLEKQKTNVMSQLQSMVDNKDIDAAKALLVTAVTWFPMVKTADDYVALQQQISRAEEIQRLLTMAQQYLAEDKLQQPEGENAAETFRSVLVLDSASKEALAGLQSVAARYRQLALQQQKKQDYEKALKMVASGLSVAPENSELQTLKTQLQQQLKSQQRIQQLLAEAQAMTVKGAIFTRVSGAVPYYLQVLAQDAKNPVATKSLQQLLQQRYQLIAENINRRAFDKATTLVEEALQVLPRDERLLELLLEVESSRPAIDKLHLSARTIDSLQQAQPKTVAADRTLYIGFHYKNLVEPTSVFQAILWDGSRSLQIAAVPVVVTGSEGEARFRIDRAVEGFTEGGYHIDIMLADRPVYTQAFTIAK